MKKFLLALTAMMTLAGSASAMSYEQARREALFLTDKMAYELNLTDDQYEAAYEINLDYLMSINDYNDLYGTYWTRRNLDLSYILLDWQYRAFCAANYFYRPLYWSGGFWHFGIYARYPHRDYFFFGRPHFWTTYRGGHSWRMNGGRSWYRGREFGRAHRNEGGRGFGMRDGFNRGDFRQGGPRGGANALPKGQPNGRMDPARGGINDRGRSTGSANRPQGTYNRGSFGGSSQAPGSMNRPSRGSDNRPSNGMSAGQTSRPADRSSLFGGQSRNFNRDNNSGMRESSTRQTVTRGSSSRGVSSAPSRSEHSSSSFSGGASSAPRNTFSPSRQSSSPSRSSSSHGSSFGSSSRSSSSHSSGVHSGSSHSSSRGGGFGGHR